MKALIVASILGPKVEHFFDSLGHRVTPIGLAAVVLAVVALVAYVVLWVMSRYSRPSLSAVLEPYRMAGSAPGSAASTPPLITLPFLQRFANGLQEPLRGTSLGITLERMLERAGSRLRVGELMTIWVIGGAIFVALGWLLAGLAGMAMILVLVIVVPPVVIQVFVERRARLFATQLPDVLKLTASSLRAGFSLIQGLDSVTRQVREPSRSELLRVLAEARLGRPVDEALEDAALRIGNRDFSESVVAVGIQQETGGNLAALFDTLADTMVQRLQMRREVRTLTAEGRLSAYVLGAMPLALGIFIFVVNRPYELILFNSSKGQILLIAGLVLLLGGFYWMYRVVKIET